MKGELWLLPLMPHLALVSSLLPTSVEPEAGVAGSTSTDAWRTLVTRLLLPFQYVKSVTSLQVTNFTNLAKARKKRT
jgi:hypothetical protein